MNCIAKNYDPQKDLRDKWRQYWSEFSRIQSHWENLMEIYESEWDVGDSEWSESPIIFDSPGLTLELADLRCGAKTRVASPCKRRDLHPNGRCKLHGGLSTGPITVGGKRISSENWKARWMRTPWEPENYWVRNLQWDGKTANESSCSLGSFNPRLCICKAL